MIENSADPTAKGNISLSRYLFDPFRIVAGSKALILGIVILLIAAFVGSLSNTHFDGVLDFHTGLKAPAWLFLAESLIDWLCMVLFLFFSALIVSRSQWRFIDILGTQALSRWPTLLTALVMLPEANHRFVEYLLMSMLGQSSVEATLNPTDAVIFFVATIIGILVIIWMVALMYKAYAVCCNVKGAKAVVTFTVSLILAEIVSKVLILALFSASGTDIVMGNLMGQSTQGTAVISEFENDSELIGEWQSVDFVDEVTDFQPGVKLFKGNLSLKSMRFMDDGTTSSRNIWTRDWIFTADGETKAQYHIKSIDGGVYLFYPWLSGDVTIRGMKPKYYVLKKILNKTG